MNLQHCFIQEDQLSSLLNTQKEKIHTIIIYMEQYKQIGKQTAKKIRRLFTNIYKSHAPKKDRQRELAIINESIIDFLIMQYKANDHSLETMYSESKK